MSVILALLLATQVAPAGPAAPAPVAVDPARLPVATRVAGRLMPEGTYRTMMKAMTDQMIGMISGQMGDMPLRDIVQMGGLSEDQAAKLGPATINDMMEILDPAYQRRTDITMRVIFDEMGELMTAMEPEYRAGLADALASRFTREQLDELDRFFATPAGAAYAGQSLALYTDPALMARMQGMMPKVMGAMPAIMKKVEAATADLPKMRDPDSLSTEEKARFEALLRLEDKK